MALTSPGIQISINDQSQYVNSNVGSVPLVILATAQDKTYNGTIAAGTTKDKAGKLLSFSSQRDLVTQMGTPTFQLGSSGTPVNGSEINEYGLLTAYSALGIGNSLYAIRADVDLNQLKGTSNRPVGAPTNLTYWLDLTNTEFGLYKTNTATQTFTHVNPILITDGDSVDDDAVTFAPTVVSIPKSNVGQPGDYALVFVNNTLGNAVSTVRLFYKTTTDSVPTTVSPAGPGSNAWVQVGSPEWQWATPAVSGTVPSPASYLNYLDQITINTLQVVVPDGVTTPSGFATLIANSLIPGVSASFANGKFELFADDTAASNGATADGQIIFSGSAALLTALGLTAGTYKAPRLVYGTYSQEPDINTPWFSAGARVGLPSNSVWWKTSSIGTGFSPVLKQYSTSSAGFNSLSASMYPYLADVIYGIDPLGGGTNINNGQTAFTYGVTDNTWNGLTLQAKRATSVSAATGGAPAVSITGSITVSYTQPGTSTLGAKSITLSGTTASSFVTDILGAAIPYVTASLSNDGTITITHTSGGVIYLSNNFSGTAVEDAGFDVGQGTGFTVDAITGVVTITNFDNITDTVEYSASQPYSAPDSGTYWYYSNSAEVDIMINDNGWKGYATVASDVRGWDLRNTDINGVIVATSEPTTQSDNSTPVVQGDIWLNSGDLDNYPALYRYDGANWVAIDNTDHTSAAGIIFADARWDSTGTTDIITGALPAIGGTNGLIKSSYIDQDAPDYRLYPRGALLFNTRRSGYNVKSFVKNYFNATSFSVLPNVPGGGSNGGAGSTTLPDVKDAWVSASGLDSKQRMKAGPKAQRAIVVAAMQSAVSSNLDVLEPTYQFNLICAPGYAELIPNLITLNNSRGSTGFIIGDTPMTLAPNAVTITNYLNNTSGDGLPSDASANAYLGLYYPAGVTNDLAGNQVVVPASHAVLRTFLFNDNVSYPWFAPAGTQRGLIGNMSDIGYINATTGAFVHNGISQGLRDSLYILNVNPLTQLPGTGLVVWGQVTRSGTNTARNRINVVRLENYLRTAFNSVANAYLFEPNDAITRKSIATQIESSLHDILSKRGLYDFLVICDTSNNTPSTIANNQLWVDVAIEPMRDVEFIYIPIAIYNPGDIAKLNTTST
jgi:hypothetical protein